eukprot:Skav235434  [mRNA]  locus=scaffold774:38008:38274:+ [translate_table: standard]
MFVHQSPEKGTRKAFNGQFSGPTIGRREDLCQPGPQVSPSIAAESDGQAIAEPGCSKVSAESDEEAMAMAWMTLCQVGWTRTTATAAS